MIPVDQTKFKENERGNCVAACVASIMDLDIDQIPAFEENAEKGGWKEELKDFVGGAGYTVEVGYEDHVPSDYYIIVGTAPTGMLHACVGHNGSIVHDPHPNRLGLTEIKYVIYFSEAV